MGIVNTTFEVVEEFALHHYVTIVCLPQTCQLDVEVTSRNTCHPGEMLEVKNRGVNLPLLDLERAGINSIQKYGA